MAMTETTTLAGHAEAVQEGVKEVSNWITVVTGYSPGAPWIHFLHRWENVIFSFTVAAGLILLARLGLRRRAMIPGTAQNVLEALAETIEKFILEILGAQGRQHIPFIGTLFLYIWFQNLMGIVPAMKAPTSNLNTTAALAITVFFYVQWTALRDHGLLGYFDHLMGSPRDLVGWLMVPLNLPLHILEEFIKPVSLSLRLFGNILGEDALIAAFVTLGIAALAFAHSPVGIPLQMPFMLLAIITGTIQAVVFSVLTTIYISLVSAHHEPDHSN